MSRNARTSRNRYKKENGKGATALAVFLTVALLLMVGGYYFFGWHQRQSPAPPPSPQLVEPIPAPTPLPPAVTPQPARSAARMAPPQAPAAVTPPIPTGRRSSGGGELAVIVDDMGSSLAEVERLTAIGAPITYSVIPGLRDDAQVAAVAAARGGEVMLHIPMQPKGYPQRRLEANGLLLTYDDGQLVRLLEADFARVPQAVGANNHMGSAFTEDRAKMRVVLEQLKKRGMFFVDSVTTPDTVGSQVAAELGVKTARRDLFLDNEQDETYIRGQLQKAVERARRTGRAIAICHPHPATIATLAKVLPGLKGQGITLVHVSRLLR